MSKENQTSIGKKSKVTRRGHDGRWSLHTRKSSSPASPKNLLNYRLIITQDRQTGTGKEVYTAFCPTLGVADDGNTIEEAIKNVTGAIEAYVTSLVEDGEPVPMDLETDMITATQIKSPKALKPV